MLERFAVQLDVGHDSTPCPKTWDDVLEWMSRPFPSDGIPWEDDARHGWLTSDIRRQASMRVRAAVDVTWMTREGW